MEEYKFFLVLLALTSLHRAAVVGHNFQAVLRLASAPIDYEWFCSELYEGGDKIACRVNLQRSVGLLVCKSATINGVPCNTVINKEIENLSELTKAGVKTVFIHPYPITGLNCPGAADEVCSGMLEEWIDSSTGMFQHIRDAIVEGSIPTVIQEVKKYTRPGGLDQTALDLGSSLFNYMRAEETKYRQICDLQGFFLKDGGFKVMDVPAIVENMGLNDRCGDGEPTTKKVIDALAAMVTSFHPMPSQKGGGGGGGGGGGQQQRKRQRQRQRQGEGPENGGRQRQRQPEPKRRRRDKKQSITEAFWSIE